MTQHYHAPVLALAVACFTVATAHGQALIENSSFDQGTIGWQNQVRGRTVLLERARQRWQSWIEKRDEKRDELVSPLRAAAFEKIATPAALARLLVR